MIEKYAKYSCDSRRESWFPGSWSHSNTCFKHHMHGVDTQLQKYNTYSYRTSLDWNVLQVMFVSCLLLASITGTKPISASTISHYRSIYTTNWSAVQTCQDYFKSAWLLQFWLHRGPHELLYHPQNGRLICYRTPSYCRKTATGMREPI